MKFLGAGFLVAMAAGTMFAGGDRVATPVRVAICIDLSGASMRDRTQIRFAAGGASELFAPAGVFIDWRLEGPCERGLGVVEVALKLQSASEGRPGALAYAFPFQQTRIVIFYDRVTAMAQSNSVVVNRLLAYVLAHEITHILQGVNTHAESGIMKANWTYDDNYRMRNFRLGFTAHDLDLIYMCEKSKSKF